ncbi:MAG: hypothetical protein COA94_03570 [Rickettsiales bacterium]|nr:MAG: hypothetical protein COA94_03570 [Rickettsiales bacterium]
MSLVTLSTNADPASIDKILNLMEKIQSALTQSKTEDNTDENTAIADWNDEEISLNRSIGTLTT